MESHTMRQDALDFDFVPTAEAAPACWVFAKTDTRLFKAGELEGNAMTKSDPAGVLN
jgi:hypothetical protein